MLSYSPPSWTGKDAPPVVAVQELETKSKKPTVPTTPKSIPRVQADASKDQATKKDECKIPKATVRDRTPRKNGSGKTKGIKRAREQEHELTPEAPKKPCPAGMGGKHSKAATCVVWGRGREKQQRGQACPTCQNIMRNRRVRSIPAILGDAGLQQEIAEESLTVKCCKVSGVDQEMKQKLTDVEKLLKKLHRCLETEDVD